MPADATEPAGSPRPRAPSSSASPSSPAGTAAPGWWRRLDTLRVKLFVGIAGVNVLLVLLAYLVHGWSFDQGLVAYLNRADEARLAPLVERLAQGHAEHGSWRWLVDDHGAWHRLLQDELGLRPPRERSRDRGPGADPASAPGTALGRPPEGAPAGSSERPPAPRQPPALLTEGRLMLLDAQRVGQIGPAAPPPDALLTPIEAQGRVVGYLGRLPRRELVETLESAVSARQGRQFAAIALAMLAAVLLNAALIARWLGRRLAVLGAGAAAVAEGDYRVRLPARGHDELARLTEDFNRMAASLEATRQARDRWIADIAHELRTPLAGLRAEIEALQDGVRQPTPDRLDSLATQVQRLTRLVDDLRLLSLSDLGALDYRVEPLDLGELVSEFLQAAPIACEGLRLQLDAPVGLRVRADADRLLQVLGNLLQNTVRYCDAPATLAVRLVREGPVARLVWEDSAPGVAPEDLTRLTERLYRVDPSRARASGGSGLGLAIVRALVEGQGGHLAASPSTLGGLRWDIQLPLLQPVPTAPILPEHPHG